MCVNYLANNKCIDGGKSNKSKGNIYFKSINNDTVIHSIVTKQNKIYRHTR